MTINKPLPLSPHNIKLGKEVEIQLHCAITLIRPGDMLNFKDADARKDQEEEIGQWCIRIEPKFFGHVKKATVEHAFNNFAKIAISRMRVSGILAPGE
jgi:hypothetical protein